MDKVQEKTKTPVTKDEKLDDALDDSFPASDPPSQTNPHRSTIKKPPVPNTTDTGDTGSQKTAD